VKHCIIISRRDEFLDEMKKFVETKTYYQFTPIKLHDSRITDKVAVYQFIFDKINTISGADLIESVVLVDEYFSIKDSNPIHINNSEDSLFGMLLLAFPELRFLFPNPVKGGYGTIIDWINNQDGTSSKKTPFLPLFDCNRLRHRVRVASEMKLKIRDKRARVVEDEISYAYFHGYIAYKYGYSCELYTTLNHLEQGQGEKKEEVDSQTQGQGKKEEVDSQTQGQGKKEEADSQTQGQGKKEEVDSQTQGQGEKEEVDLQIQDLSLGFVDKREKLNLSVLSARYSEFPFLKIEKNSYIITTGEKPEEETNEKVIYKPTKGMYDLAKLLQLKEDCTQNNEETTNGHSAHGILTLIARGLIVRSQNILDNAGLVTDAIHAALLALEAKELLNGLTPTLALHALSLQQEAEVTAECLFVGTEYNINVEDRFKNIEAEVTDIAQKFSEQQREKVVLNTRLSLVESLAGIFSTYRQFEEELKCLNEARTLFFKIRIKGPSWDKIAYTLLRPANFILRSGWSFFGSIIVLQFIFGLIYFLWDHAGSHFSCRSQDIEDTLTGYAKSVLVAAKYFFTSQTNEQYAIFDNSAGWWADVVLTLQGFLSIGMLSLFIAFVFLRVSRK